MINNKQRLNHNLLPYIKRTGDMLMFSHPAYVCAYFSDPHIKSNQNFIINNKVNTQYPRYLDARNSGNFYAALSFIDPAHRLDTFLRIKDEIKDDAEYWKVVNFTLESQPTGYSDTGPWVKVFSRAGNPNLKREFFQKLPEYLTVYQCGAKYEFGTAAMKWTLSKTVAEAETRNYGGCTLKIGTVEKAHVLHLHIVNEDIYLYADSRNVKVE